MDSIKTIQGVFYHFQNSSVDEQRAKELFAELSIVNQPVKEAYEVEANFNAQPADFLSMLLELRRKEPSNDD